MKKRLLTISALFGLLLSSNIAHAVITGASVTPTQRQLTATSINVFAASWRVTTNALHRTGATSSAAALVNPANSVILGNTGGSLTATGSGPFTFNETVTITQSQVRNWQSLGVSAILLRRDFLDAVSGTSATAVMRLLVPPAGQLTAARVTPSQNHLLANENNEFNASWYVTAGSGHSNGVVSSSARIVNPRTGATLTTVGSSLSANGGGPFLFNESISLDASLVQGLLGQRLDRVVLQRTFVDPVGGGSVEASMTLLLSSSRLTSIRDALTGALSIQSMRLEFANGNNMELVDLNDSLQAKLILVHSGTGLLEGRWQIAEPGSTETIPLYRTLALVRRNITGTQRSILHSPELPTSRTGRYLLRFCVTNREMITDDSTGTEQCPIEKLVVNAAYQVQGDAAFDMVKIRILSPNRQNVDAATPFSWQAVAGAKVYQMQIFALVSTNNGLPSSEDNEETIEPRFIVGMVLPAETTRTPLSELVCSKLQPDRRYLWRITAHDETGRLLGSSSDASFVFSPLD